MWGSGHGLEDIKQNDTAYYDRGMRAALRHCSDTNCALIVNPMHHRTVEQLLGGLRHVGLGNQP